jgi:hypothetical protein
MDVALVTCSRLPDLVADDRCLLGEIRERGLSVGVRVWDDPGVDWGEACLTLLRSTWDYHLRPSAFLGWAEHVSRVTRLVNPLPVVRWNTHKGYLRELGSRGAPVVPTDYLPAGARLDLEGRLAALGWGKAVLKPAVSCDSWGALLVDVTSPDSLAAGRDHLERLGPERDLMIQPFLPGVVEPGERSLVFVEGELSHAVRKRAPFGVPVAGGESAPVEPEPDERAAARRVLDACPHPPQLYARVDLARDQQGRPLLMELELVEPSLFLSGAPEARRRLVDGILRRLRERG